MRGRKMVLPEGHTEWLGQRDLLSQSYSKMKKGQKTEKEQTERRIEELLENLKK